MIAECQDFRDKKVLDFLIEKRYRIKRHVLFLTVFFLMLCFGSFIDSYGTPYGYYAGASVYIIFVVMFYVNMYVLVPCFLFKSKYVPYAIFLILLAVLGVQILSYFHENYFNLYLHKDYLEAHKLMHKNNTKADFYGVIIVCASLISVSTTIKLLQRWLKDNERITELNNITFAMELNELKNQVSPHFLFNMLNNVKALIRTNPEMANTVIIRLSEFLRYQLYENSGERTILASEIEFISNFLNLEQIRKDNFKVEIENHIDKNTLNSTFISPGLFTVFIENAIKHSVDPNGDETYVKISIDIKDKQLHFVCINSKFEDNHLLSKNKSNGLGLANIKRRLELLYRNNYQLNITSNAKEYIVNLTIPL
ncbi:MAG: histidine kinase [Myroides sp.]